MNVAGTLTVTSSDDPRYAVGSTVDVSLTTLPPAAGPVVINALETSEATAASITPATPATPTATSDPTVPTVAVEPTTSATA